MDNNLLPKLGGGGGGGGCPRVTEYLHRSSIHLLVLMVIFCSPRPIIFVKVGFTSASFKKIVTSSDSNHCQIMYCWYSGFHYHDAFFLSYVKCEGIDYSHYFLYSLQLINTILKKCILYKINCLRNLHSKGLCESFWFGCGCVFVCVYVHVTGEVLEEVGGFCTCTT